MKSTRRALGLCAALVAGCGPEADDVTRSQEVRDIAIYDASGKNIAWSHGSHWDGSISLSQGQPLEVTFKYMGTLASHESDPSAHFSLEGHDDLTLRVSFLDATVVGFTGDHVRGRFEGKFVGSTRATFTLRRGVETLLRTPDVRIVVRE
jgi:hypothetical protein